MPTRSRNTGPTTAGQPGPSTPSGSEERTYLDQVSLTIKDWQGFELRPETQRPNKDHNQTVLQAWYIGAMTYRTAEKEHAEYDEDKWQLEPSQRTHYGHEYDFNRYCHEK
jgi:hypothetical protein